MLGGNVGGNVDAYVRMEWYRASLYVHKAKMAPGNSSKFSKVAFKVSKEVAVILS